MTTIQKRRHHLLSIIVIGVLVTSLCSIQNAVRLTHHSNGDDSNEHHVMMDWWDTHAFSGRDLAASITHNSHNHTLSQQHHIHPWSVRQQSHPANPTPCQQRIWFKNRTLVHESCFPLPTLHVCRTPFGLGPEGIEGASLLQNIRPKMPSNRKRNPRILCLVYTSHDNHHALVQTIVHTWGKRCDGFLAMSNVNDTSIGALHLHHEGPESYNNMWQKTRSILKYAHDHYLQDFDFFHVCGDDVYLIIENMKDYLASDEVMHLGKPHGMSETPTSFQQLKPLFLGAPMFMTETWYACAGGSGYTLNQAALKLYATQLYDKCHVHERSSMEDVFISECLWNAGVKCQGWNVQQRSTRYHGMDADDQASGALSPLGGRKLRRFHNIKIAEGPNGASPHSFAFHLKSHRFRKSPKSLRMFMMQRYEAIVYDLCPKHANFNAAA